MRYLCVNITIGVYPVSNGGHSIPDLREPIHHQAIHPEIIQHQQRRILKCQGVKSDRATMYNALDATQDIHTTPSTDHTLGEKNELWVRARVRPVALAEVGTNRGNIPKYHLNGNITRVMLQWQG